MGTDIRPELSEKSKYWIDKHRYYELKHFCLQYPIWKKAYAALGSLSKREADFAIFSKSLTCGNPTEKCALARAYYSDRMDMIARTAAETDPVLKEYILKAVTEGFSYNYLKTKMDIPCGKDVYYQLYRQFFWLLNKERQ